MTKYVDISTEYITLGQLLKVADVISSGGMAKWFIQEHDILVNGELEKRRGRKLIKGDMITIPSMIEITIK